MTGDLSCALVIFGADGDLAHRKLMPALYNLTYSGNIPEHFAVAAVGRREKTDEEYRNEVYASIMKYSRMTPDADNWNRLKERITYVRLDFSENEGYSKLEDCLTGFDKKYGTRGNRVYYLAVAPENFELVAAKLKEHGLAKKGEAWQRLVIEKPFGRNLDSARNLNRNITATFTEGNTFRIDHYLGKEMLQNIMVIRFANSFFEPVWNNRFIDNIQISACETVGVGLRGGYYERSGALRDMIQNHLLQLLTLVAMEPPVDLSAESIRDEKVKVLRSMEAFTPELVSKNVVRGQYGPGMAKNMQVPGYRQEARISAQSDTETFIALKTHIDNFRWAGVPFYLRTGKRMPSRSIEVVINFKPLPRVLYFKENEGLESNMLVIKIQPQERVFYLFNAKRPGTENRIVPVQMDFCQNCDICDVENNSPESYERLLLDVMKGDSTLFTRWDEVEYSWRFVDRIADGWESQKPGFPNYAAGTWGPAEADELLARDGRKWYNKF